MSSPWFEGDLLLTRLSLALDSDGSLTESQLAVADADLRLWAHRRDLARLRYDFMVRQGRFERALAAAQECERLGRNAGLETVPAANGPRGPAPQPSGPAKTIHPCSRHVSRTTKTQRHEPITPDRPSEVEAAGQRSGRVTGTPQGHGR